MKDRAWVTGTGSANMVYNVTSAESKAAELLDFNDIESDEDVISRERSEWYFERLILWFRISFIPDDPSAAVPWVYTRLGVMRDTGAVDESNVLPQDGLDRWDRVLQDELISVWKEQPWVFNGGSLVAEPAEAATDFSYTIPIVTHKWDLTAKFRLPEKGSLMLQYGPIAGEALAGEQFELQYVWKGLLRRGQ